MPGKQRAQARPLAPPPPIRGAPYNPEMNRRDERATTARARGAVAPDAAGAEPTTAAAPAPHRGRIDWLSVGAWAFEIFTAALSIVDVLSDVLVAMQFYDAGHMGWFWMVIASLFVSNCVYSVMAMAMVLDERWQMSPTSNNWRAAGYFCAVFPFAQAFPLVQWFLEVREQVKQDALGPKVVHSKRRAYATESDDGDDGMPLTRSDSWTAQATSRAAQEDLDEDEQLRLFVRRMHKSFERHMKANAGFYVETVVEAAPQAVIQLVAVTALGEATGLQLLSMCLSLFSIVTKAYVVCVTYDLRAMAFKAALIAFDVFSLFHVFATVLAREEVVETTLSLLVPSVLGISDSEPSGFPGFEWVPLRMSHLAASWLWKDLHLIVTAMILLAGLGMFIVVDEYVFGRRRPDYFAGFVIAGGFIVCFFPAALALEAAKLSFFLFPLLALLPGTHAMPFYACSFGFYRRGLAKGRSEAFERLKHVLHYCVTTSAAKQRDETMARHRQSHAKQQRNIAQTGRARRRYQPRAPRDVYLDFMEQALHRLIDEGRLQLWSFRRPQYVDPHLPPPPPQPKWSWSEFFGKLKLFPRRVWNELRRWWTNASRKDRTLVPVMWIGGIIAFQGMCMYVYAVLFNLAFPFVHAWRYGIAHQNVLQLTCLACSGASLAVIVLLLPFMFRFVTFTFVVREVCQSLGTSHTPQQASEASEMVSQYHKPPQVGVLKAAISVSVLPFDVTEEVASFLALNDLDLSSLSVEQCAALKDRAGDTTN
uniref:XK-related protein n=1 Tax=Neobodo designis TaxID=312471 RepID=A0A7S1PND7_NEODS|mmetsp:Transcript_13683/g.42576  ORF Transcript_13683/g.42576 Transcript_13683/m.42576 type:complete len:762 (+) Transcript_13683:52-2337(+)|eukprot:CAMPEP_0174848982 /NCGR_PEP_ID=MMETSP1114-20130205/13836_1 /TAXON_ID=312471 /ORGANISM="Neobodo designis, Strain CCAP 1951/1" /LENGTH=761 /DNA_ID=CAMNT_0016083289 /DNA_START=45 /DNA_END=2330 /DNA_ORIENTATION=+